MRKFFRATRALTDTARPAAVQHHASRRLPPERRCTRRRPAAARRDEGTSLWIEEPPRFHHARYEHLIHPLHGRFHQTAALLTCLVLLMLAWRAGDGACISPDRWFCGVLSGWFIALMSRLALFTYLAAPRSIRHAGGRLYISGLGYMRPGQITHWSIEHGVLISPKVKPGARLRLCCRWFGVERRWTMLMEEDGETARLQRLLALHVPRSSDAAMVPAVRVIQIEAGVLSQ